jgi:hypothetical protein
VELRSGQRDFRHRHSRSGRRGRANRGTLNLGVVPRPFNLVGRTNLRNVIGIHPDRLGKTFETFYKTKRSGTELGLSIARTIIETYGGKLWAEKGPNGGAKFCFTLPLSKVATA